MTVRGLKLEPAFWDDPDVQWLAVEQQVEMAEQVTYHP